MDFNLAENRLYRDLIRKYYRDNKFERARGLDISPVPSVQFAGFFRPRKKIKIYNEELYPSRVPKFFKVQKYYNLAQGLHYFGVPQMQTAFRYSSPKIRSILNNAIQLNSLNPIKENYKLLSSQEKQEIDRFLETVNLVMSPKGYQYLTNYGLANMPFNKKYLNETAKFIFANDPKRIDKIKKYGLTTADIDELMKDPIVYKDVTSAQPKKGVMGSTIGSVDHRAEVNPIWLRYDEQDTSTPFHEFKHRLLNRFKSKGYFISDKEKSIYNSAFPDINMFDTNIKKDPIGPLWKIYSPTAQIPGNIKRANVNRTINYLDEKATSAIDMRNNINWTYAYKQFTKKHGRIPYDNEINDIIDKLTISDIRKLMTTNDYQIRRAIYYDKYPKLWNYDAIKQAMKLKQGNKITYNK